MKIPVLVAFLFGPLFCQAQEVQWMTFEEMEVAFGQQPKRIFIDFWAEWCGYCKRMDTYVFTNQVVSQILNEEYYPVKMNAETRDTIFFGGKYFVNPTPAGENGFHSLAVLLGKNEEGSFTLPTVAIFDEQFQPLAKYHHYMHSKKLLKALR